MTLLGESWAEGDRFWAAACLVVLLPREFVLGPRLEAAVGTETAGIPAALGALGYTLVSLAVVLLLVSAQSYSPFLYFQF